MARHFGVIALFVTLGTATSAEVGGHAAARDWRPPNEAVGLPFSAYFGAGNLAASRPLAAASVAVTSSDASRPAPKISEGAAPAMLPAHAASLQWTCRPTSTCEPCPAKSLHYPYCRPYNNRRGVQCERSVGTGGKGEVYDGYEACGKVVQTERWDYLEFVVSVTMIAVLSLFGFSRRQQMLAQQRYELLSRRVDSS